MAVYQTLPWDYRSWLSASGSNGNANKMGYVGFEICEDDLKDRGYFNRAVMETSVLLTAHLCQLFGIRPWHINKEFKQGKAYAVLDHSELYDLRIGSNHGDISIWLKKYG